jgi:quercetin dioxygenase-like cupin family protein
MNRKTFLTQLGGVGMMTMLPLTSVRANNAPDAIIDKRLKGKVVTADAGEELTIFGNKQLHKLVGKDTNSQFFEWTDYLKPGSGIPPHIHTKEDEVFRVTQGMVEFTIGGKKSVLNAGDMALAPKNIPHSWRVVGDKDAEMSVSVFPAGMEFMFEELNALPPGRPDFKKVSDISAKYGIQFV